MYSLFRIFIELFFFSSVFVNPETNEVLAEGDIFLWPSLANTLQMIADNGGDEFYSGFTAINLINDMKNWGGNMTIEDLSSYQ